MNYQFYEQLYLMISNYLHQYLQSIISKFPNLISSGIQIPHIYESLHVLNPKLIATVFLPKFDYYSPLSIEGNNPDLLDLDLVKYLNYFIRFLSFQVNLYTNP